MVFFPGCAVIAFDMTRIISAIVHAHRGQADKETYGLMDYYREWCKRRLQQHDQQTDQLTRSTIRFTPIRLADEEPVNVQTQLRALSLQLLRGSKRTPMNEGRFESLLTSVPAPPKAIAVGQSIRGIVH